MDKPTPVNEAPTTVSVEIYSWWDEVPEHLKTQEQLKQKGLMPTGMVQARVVYGHGRRARSYDLYNQRETRPHMRKEPTLQQKARQESLRSTQNRLELTCRSCRKVMEKASLLGTNGLCTRCE